MQSKLTSKLKGMIFSERPVTRSGRTPTKDEAQAELISDGAGPSSDGAAEAEPHKTQNPSLEEGAGSVKKQRNGKKKKSSMKKRESPEKGSLQRQNQLIRGHQKHDSTQQVHVCDYSVGGASNIEPIKHFIDSCNNTPIRNLTSKNSVADDMRVLLNVGGVRHETHVATLRNVPNSRLSRLADMHINSGRGKQEYFFDRHPSVFNSIIDFYRTGELHVPLEVCGAVVKRELDFWQIEELDIKACCWRHYRQYIENQRILGSFNHSLQREQMTVDLVGLRGWKLWQTKLWLILDHPRTSRAALAYGIVSFLFVVASIAGFCLETIPELRPKVSYNISSASCNGETKTIQVVMASNTALNVLDFICTVFFTLELVLRFVVSPEKLRFVRNPMNIIDLLALVPLYVQVIFEQSELQACYINERFVIEIMFILRIFRMFRIFHLVKHYQALKVLVYALMASLQELLMLFIFLLIGMLIFSTMIYYAERNDSARPDSEFNTIPIGFWWAIITMTTVGYGDVTPSTPVGYIVGSACSICGVLLLALTIPVISNNFTLFYEHVRSRSTSPRKKEEVEEEGEEEVAGDGSEASRDHPTDYGALKMHNLSTSSGAAANGFSSTVMNGRAKIKDAQGEAPSIKPKYYVPIAKFSDTSSMTDIIFQEPTDDLIAIKAATPKIHRERLRFKDFDSSPESSPQNL